EIALAIEAAKQHNIQPVLGIRAKLNCSGNNRWGNSTGDRAKFGLTAVEIMQAINQLKAADMLDALQLLHFHIGSQISAIAKIKEALNEAGQIYINLCQLGANMRYIDVGGGLGIDYDGSQTNSPASKNYSMQNYANDVVAEIQAACNSQQLASPIIVSESGRAIASHQSVLLLKVLGIDEVEDCKNHPQTNGYHPIVKEISDIYNTLDSTNCQELYNDLLQAKKNIEQLFSLGYLTLQERAAAESLFWGCCKQIQRLNKNQGSISDELRKLDEVLTSVYYCNFSVFQSMPDSWAIDQLFPIMPIHRLREKPTELGILADLTCDSDGKIDQFIGQKRSRPYLELHKWNQKQPYYLGVFLGGAYQEIMGSLHNLFGDTNAVHVRLEEDGYHIEHVVRGDSIAKVLSYVQYHSQNMVESLRQETERALKEKRITLQESLRFLKHYEDSLLNYTYLAED
ncbi:MAG: biosynthetic arginine decarboxylase, partial [Phormidesmis sp.]